MAAFFHCLTSPGGPSRFWPFADKSGIRAAEDRTQVATYRRSPITSIRRFSSAVEQRFCKPKVGSSILSTGTSIYNDLALNSPAFSPHSELTHRGVTWGPACVSASPSERPRLASGFPRRLALLRWRLLRAESTCV